MDKRQSWLSPCSQGPRGRRRGQRLCCPGAVTLPPVAGGRCPLGRPVRQAGCLETLSATVLPAGWLQDYANYLQGTVLLPGDRVSQLRRKTWDRVSLSGGACVYRWTLPNNSCFKLELSPLRGQLWKCCFSWRQADSLFWG